ncbi:uncharacterized protein V6R79_013960 [Siganus canaliculatus]
MITQYIETLPEGTSHPDFTRKPIALTIQEGKFAFFKAIVIGDPKPAVTWSRNNGDVSDTSRYQAKYDPNSNEHTFEMPNVTPDQADTYKCFAKNEYGQAMVTVVLNVIEVGYKKNKVAQQAEAPDGNFKTVLKRRSKVRPKTEQPEKKDGEIDPKFWELLLSADKKDYERICAEFGVTDFRWMLKKLNEMKKEREEEQAEFVKNLSSLRPIQVNADGTASFELDMDLLDPSSSIYLYKDGEMIPYTKELGDKMKHSLKQVGRKYIFSVRDLLPDDAGLYQVDVDDVNVFSTDFKIPMVDFLVKIQEVKAMEREDAVFECVLSNPMSKILWFGKNLPLESGDKYEIQVSEDKLIHRLVVKDCMVVDKGIYSACAGIKSCNAWLVVEADKTVPKGKKAPRKTTKAGGSGIDLEKVAQEQQTKLEKVREERKEQIQAAKEAAAAAPPPTKPAAEPKKPEKPADPPVVKEPSPDPGITSGLSDIHAFRGKPAELTVMMNMETDGAWFKDGEQLTSSAGVTITKDGTSHKLMIQSCSDDDSGVYRFVSGDLTTQGKVTVGDVPEFDPDDLHKFSKPVIIRVGQNAAFKMPFPPQDSLVVSWFKDGTELKDSGGVKIVREPNHSRLLLRDCLRTDAGEIKIRLQNPFGAAEATSQLIVLDRPGPPEGPVETTETTSTLIEIAWKPPKDDGGSPVTNYIIERQQAGQSLWTKLGDVSADKTSFRDRNVSHGKKYNYRIYAENPEGLSDALETADSIMAGVMILSGPPGAPQVVSASKTCINLTWTPPEDDRGVPIVGYQLEKRKKDTNEWIALNAVNEPIESVSYAVKDVTEGAYYEFRVAAINESGAGDLSPPSAMVCAKNPNMRPHFKDPEDFIVVRAGNSARVKVAYEAEPPPQITWLKDDEPISPWIRIINTDGMSQLVIPSSKRSDSAIYTIIAKNSVGEASFDIEVRVTDEPKMPGPVELEQTVQGKVLVSWAPSPDQELDDRLYYVVSQHDSNTRMWKTVADRLSEISYTAQNILPGIQYLFRIYAKNDMGLSDPSQSPTWGVNSNRVQTSSNGLSTDVCFERPPSILVPLKVHTPPKGYQLYMTCAIRGCPTPSVSWYLNGVCINSDNNYYITNSFGVCSMYILRVRPKDGGEYKVVAINSFGKAECSSTLVVRGKKAFLRAMVSGQPTPTVTWGRNKGNIDDPKKYKMTYDEKTEEHVLEIISATADQAGTYRCFAVNEYGKATCTANLNILGSDNEPHCLFYFSVITRKKQLPPPKKGEIDPKLWELLLSAPKKDYERLCFEYGVTDFRWMLKRLKQLKKDREDEQAKVVEEMDNVKQIEVKPDGTAEFSLDMKLWDPNSTINLYKDGTLIPYGDDENSKHSMKKTGTKYVFTIKDPQPEDAGFYQVDVEEANVLATDFQVPLVEFAAKIENVEVTEGEDAVFQCVLSTPLNRITWSRHDSSLEHGEKYKITVSEDKLTHALRVRDCEMDDRGAYYAIAGITSSTASLTVIADPNGRKHRKDAQNGDQQGLNTVALEHQANGMDGLESAKKDDSDAAAKAALGDGGDGKDGKGEGDGSDGRDGKDGREGSADGSGGHDRDGDSKNHLTNGDGEMKKDDTDNKKKKRVRNGPLVADTITDPGVQFVSGLSDTIANIGERAGLSCKLSNETAEGHWYKNGKLLTKEDGVQIIKDGAHHGLVIDCCKKDDAAVYRFEAEGRKSEATLTIQGQNTHEHYSSAAINALSSATNSFNKRCAFVIKDPPKIDAEAFGNFNKPVIIKAGENAEWKLPFSGGEPISVQWYKDDDELLPGLNVRIETSATGSSLRLTKCQRKDEGEVKIKIKNEFGTIEAISKLIVLDKPTPPQGPVDIMESAVTSVGFKWKPPKDDGGCPVTNYLIQRQQVGRNKWSNLGELPGDNLCYKDSDVDPGRRYSYRIRAKNTEGISDHLQTEDIPAGILRYPSAPKAPKVVSAFKDCINLAWAPPSDTGGTKIVGYNLEKNKKGSNYWSLVNQEGPIADTKYAVKDVFEGAAYQFRVSAINLSGAGDPSLPCDTVIARDPMKPPGKVSDLKLTSSDYTTFSLAWTKPKEIKGVEDEAQGYYVEIRPIESIEWTRCNAVPITLTSYTVLGLKAMATYWVRVIATNYGGDGEPQGFDKYLIAMPPPVKPKFKDRNMKTFVVIKAGNTIRLNINFEASPLPEISWLKDGIPLSKHATITNSDKGSQLLIPTSERSDTGIYTITVKNIVGQESFNIEVRVTDDPKPPGPVVLEQNIQGTVTLSWASSPDERRDDRLHYMVSQRDSFKRTWKTVADNLFNNKFTVVNILPGQEYNFRVYAKNDMGLSPPSESPVFGAKKEKEHFRVNMPETKILDLQSPPSFLVPLKMRTAPQGYECCISCAIKGDPIPRVTWYRNNISINTNTNYHITNVCGVCSMLILRVGPKDNGEYRVIIENKLGIAECSMTLNIRVGASIMGWLCQQQQQSLDQLSESFATMQQRLTKLQQVMGKAGAQLDTALDDRITALEETQKQAQEKAEVALATSEKFKSPDLFSQLLALHDELDTRLSEMKQVTLSVSTLQAMFKNQSEEFEAIKKSVMVGLTSSSSLAENVAGLTKAVASAFSRVDEQVAAVAAFGAELEGQASELDDLKDSMHLHNVALYLHNQEVAAVKELVEAKQAKRAEALEEMLSSVQTTLDEQFSTSQTLHSSVMAQLHTFYNQLADSPSRSSNLKSNEEAPAEEENVSAIVEDALEMIEAAEDVEEDTEQQDAEDEVEEAEEEGMQEEQLLQQEMEGDVERGEQEEEDSHGEEEEMTTQEQEDLFPQIEEQEIAPAMEEDEVADETVDSHVSDKTLEEEESGETVALEEMLEESEELNSEDVIDQNEEEE